MKWNRVHTTPKRRPYGQAVGKALCLLLCLCLWTVLPVRAEALLLDCPHCAHVPAAMAVQASGMQAMAMPESMHGSRHGSMHRSGHAGHPAMLPDCCAQGQVMGSGPGLEAIPAQAVPLDQCVCSQDHDSPYAAAFGTAHGPGQHPHTHLAVVAEAPGLSRVQADTRLALACGPPGPGLSVPLFLRTKSLLL